MRHVVRIAALIFVLAGIGQTLVCDSALAVRKQIALDEEGSSRCGCFRGKPAPECCGFILLETSLRTRLNNSMYRDGADAFHGGLDVGFMVNRNSSSALGASFYASGDDDGGRWGLRGWYRRWMENNIHLDLSAGVLIAGSDNYGAPKFPGLVASASWGYADLISLDLMTEVYRFTPGDFSFNEGTRDAGTRASFFFGASGRSWAAFVLPAVVIVAFIIDPPFDDFSLSN